MFSLFRGPEEFKLIAAKEMNKKEMNKELKGFHFAVEFVCCYNGHPDFNRFTPDLESTNTAKRNSGSYYTVSAAIFVHINSKYQDAIIHIFNESSKAKYCCSNGVLEADFVEPARDKQGFERTTLLQKTRESLGYYAEELLYNGDNWSMRQRQLLCLGRLLLKDTNVLFMDEATTYVDSQADAVADVLTVLLMPGLLMSSLLMRVSSIFIDRITGFLLEANEVADAGFADAGFACARFADVGEQSIERGEQEIPVGVMDGQQLGWFPTTHSVRSI
ncbi:ABC transporter C family member 14-like protein [Tanacetum coccineum]